MAWFKVWVSIIPTFPLPASLLRFKPHKLLHWLNPITLKFFRLWEGRTGHIILPPVFPTLQEMAGHDRQTQEMSPESLKSSSPPASRSPIAKSPQFYILNWSQFLDQAGPSLLSLPTGLAKWLQLYLCFLCLPFLSSFNYISLNNLVCVQA